MTVVLAQVSDHPLDAASHQALVQAPWVGAVAGFIGTVRDHDPEADGAVTALEYSAHPDAGRIIGELAERFDAPETLIAVSHRVGRLEVGENAIVCAVATAHRAEAFQICRDLVEAVKHELPVWKKQWNKDGSHGWVGLGIRPPAGEPAAR